MDQASLYELLDQKRKELGLSKSELVRRALGPDADSTVFHNIRRGFQPRFGTVDALARVLGLTIQVGPPRHDAAHLHDGSIRHDGAPPAGLAEDAAAWSGPPVDFAGFARAAWSGPVPDPPAPRLPAPPLDVPGAQYLQQLGDGMAPEGIRHGDILLVSAGAPPAPGGLVVCAPRDGALYSARLTALDSAHAVMRSWLPPEGDAASSARPVTERRARESLARLDPIVRVIDGIPGAPGAAVRPDPARPDEAGAAPPPRAAPDLSRIAQALGLPPDAPQADIVAAAARLTAAVSAARAAADLLDRTAAEIRDALTGGG